MDATKLTTPRSDRSLAVTDRLARGLGWFSIGLGIAELAAPGMLARAVGLEGKETLLRAYGAREIGAGLGALTLADPAPAMWSRFGGDLLDLGTLAVGIRDGDEEQRRAAGIAIAAVAAVTVVDLLVALGLNSSRKEMQRRTESYRESGAKTDEATPALEAAH